jgi:hypothetical protein
MFLQCPTAHLNNLINGISSGLLSSPQTLGGSSGGNPGLRLIEAKVPADRQPSEYVGNNSALAALINAAGRSISVPTGYAPALLEIPVAWLPTMLGTAAGNVPTVGPLQLTSECACDFQGAWASFFQSLGWTGITPTVYPVQTVAG